MGVWEEFIKIENIDMLKRKNKKVLFRKKKDYLQFSRLQAKIELDYEYPLPVYEFVRKDKRRFSKEAVLDLHGFTIAQAMSAVKDFLIANSQKKIRNALIITGGSLYVNKAIRENFLDKVNGEFSSLISMCSIAAKHDGGSGAFYIKIRKK